MKLSQILSIYPQLKWGEFATADVKGISADSREIEKGYIFVAVKGLQTNGHDYLPQVCAQGAIAVIVEDASKIPADYMGAVVKVENSREALNQVAAKFYKNPAEGLFCVGVTGTNGKTSITYFIEKLLNDFGLKCGVMGTVNHHIDDVEWKTQLTTPDPITLQKRLAEFVGLGAKACAFEVSSHALQQNRVDCIPFSCVVFANLSRDHLDYHGSMEAYFLAKQKLFKELPALHAKSVFAVVNNDDEYGVKLSLAENVKLITYGQKNSDFKFKIKKVEFLGTNFLLQTPQGEAEFFVPLPGLHNVYNAVASVAVAMAAGASLQHCVESLKSFAGVPGRLQPIVNKNKIHVFVDYAHTHDALEKVLNTITEIRQGTQPQAEILTVFGCGGDRDKGKRPLMMKVALEFSDRVFVTSDNPRTEDPQQIIDDAISIVSKEQINHNVFVEIDRRKAIEQALAQAKPGDVVLIAGKGHENYQIIGTERKHFSDSEVVEEYFSAH